MNRLAEVLRSGAWLTKKRVLAYSAGLLLATIVSIIYALASGDWQLGSRPPFGADFVSFWSAAREALAGRATVPYDQSLFSAAEQAMFPGTGYFAFFYPPHYLLYLLPFGFLQFYTALVVWQIATFFFVTLILMKIAGHRRETLLLLLAYPGTILNLAYGQNAFLTAALLGGG